MKITNIYSYLTLPMYHSPVNEEPTGTDIPLQGSLYEMLAEIFNNANKECEIGISFVPEEDKQKNQARSEIIEFLKKPSVDTGKTIALRLQSVSTARSGLGLFFLIVGNEAKNRKLLLSRFPADNGIMAEARQGGKLHVEFIEKIFMKKASSYKAAVYQGTSFASDFWDGYATDKQMDSGPNELANYWVRHFLLSEFKTTSKQGTKRLAQLLKKAISDATDLETKQELISAATLASGMDRKRTSIKNFISRYNLSDETATLLTSHSRDDLVRASFSFDAEEFARQAPYRSVELDNGSIMTAPSEKFESCFDRQPIDADKGVYRFTAQGAITDERFRGRS